MRTLIFVSLMLVFPFPYPSLAEGLRPEDRIFTLYRNNDIDPSIRVHVATFDGGGFEYNHYHCKKATELFGIDAKKQGSKERFWCEKGYYQK